jgi:hypothetical protein
LITLPFPTTSSSPRNQYRQPPYSTQQTDSVWENRQRECSDLYNAGSNAELIWTGKFATIDEFIKAVSETCTVQNRTNFGVMSIFGDPPKA